MKKNNCFWKKKTLPLINKKFKSHEDAKVCHICGKYSIKNFSEINNIKKLGIIAIMQVNIEVQDIVFVF